MSEGKSLEECISELLEIQSKEYNPAARAAIYEESWQALNQWIETKLCKRKGADIPMIGKFTWEFQRSEVTKCRPIFIASDSFIKENNIKRPRIHKVPLLAPSEEINFSKLAIKFTKALTKDMVFAGVRDILKKIGDCIARGQDVYIEFSFGIFRSKERKIRFEFNQNRLMQILPENLDLLYTPNVEYYDDSRPSTSNTENMGQENSYEIEVSKPIEKFPPLINDNQKDLGMNIKPRIPVPRILLTTRSNEQENEKEEKPIVKTQEELDEAELDALLEGVHVQQRKHYDNRIADTLSASIEEAPSKPKESRIPKFESDTSKLPIIMLRSPETDYNNDYEEDDDNNYETHISTSPIRQVGTFDGVPGFSGLSPRTQQILMSLDGEVKKYDKREILKAAQDRVRNDFFLKQLHDLQLQSYTDDKTNTLAALAFQQWLRKEHQRNIDNRNRKDDLRRSLDNISSECRDRKRKDYEERKSMKVAFILSKSSNAELEAQEQRIRHERSKNLHDELSRQMKYNEEIKKIKKHKKMIEEKEYLDHVAMELDLEYTKDKADHLEKQQELLDSWEKSIHIRNIQKEIQQGPVAVNKYLLRNLKESVQDPYTLTKTQAMKSIGYDFRMTAAKKK